MGLRRAIIFEPAPLLARKIAQVVACGGGEVLTCTSVDVLAQTVEQTPPDLLCLNAIELNRVAETVNGVRDLKYMVWLSEEDHSILETFNSSAHFSNLFGLRYPNGPPRSWELVAVMRRWTGLAPPREAWLDWGAIGFERTPTSDVDRDDVVAMVEKRTTEVTGRRQANQIAEVAHELLMNAMYDAPVDVNGTPLFAGDRSASITLSNDQRPAFFWGCDGRRVVLSVTDPFGRLTREHVFGGLGRSLQSGTMDSSGGGAGLGFMVIYKACSVLVFDVVPGVKTSAIAIVELDVPQREMRHLPRSIHFFGSE